MGRDDPYRKRPWFIGEVPLADVGNNWVLYARCRSCARERRLGRICEIPDARTCTTQGELVARLTCARCGSNHPIITVEFVGKTRD